MEFSCLVYWSVLYIQVLLLWQVQITSETDSQIPFGVGLASDPMALRRGAKKLPMEDVCYYHWPLPGVDKVVRIIFSFFFKLIFMEFVKVLMLYECSDCSLDCLAFVMDMGVQRLQNLLASQYFCSTFIVLDYNRM